MSLNRSSTATSTARRSIDSSSATGLVPSRSSNAPRRSGVFGTRADGVGGGCSVESDGQVRGPDDREPDPQPSYHVDRIVLSQIEATEAHHGEHDGSSPTCQPP